MFGRNGKTGYTPKHAENAASGKAETGRTEKPSALRKTLSLLFFLIAVPWLECLLRLANSDAGFLGIGLARALLTGAALGLLIRALIALFPSRRGAVVFGSILYGLLGVLFAVQVCCRSFFGTYFSFGFMFDMTGQVAGDFLGTAKEVAVKNLAVVLLMFVPLILFLCLRKLLLEEYPRKIGAFIAFLIIAVLLQTGSVVLCRTGEDAGYYTAEFTTNSAVPRFGLLNSVRLETQYAIFGLPAEGLSYTAVEETETEPEPAEEPPAEESAEPAAYPAETAPEETAEPAEETPAEEEEPEEEPVVYHEHVLDIDFNSLMESDSGTLLTMDEYFSSQKPTMENQYTGMFKDKNLIMICAEAFSYAVIDPELTPALYELTTNGFVFNNFYQPGWTQSTTGGEFAFMTGIIPTWVGSKTAFTTSAKDLMPFGLGWLFSEEDYDCTAWHDSDYSYYGRDKTHPNLGYDYTGIGNGLTLDSQADWPPSDLEMMEATIGDKIDAYVNDGTLFHSYYMSVSGHCNYGFDINAMSEKNEDAVADVEGSEPVRAYIAAQLELEYALEYLLDELNTAGIADDTVIVMCADHYPYALSEGSTDYYNELTGNDDNELMTSRYKNALILWSGCMEEPVEVDTPCYSVDVVPTLLNLFGIDYDSRLFSGRDILSDTVGAADVSTAMHLVIFADYGSGTSWISEVGTYESATNTFTPNEGIEVDDDYVNKVSQIAKDRFTYAKYILSEDYYAHLFPDWSADQTSEEG